MTLRKRILLALSVSLLLVTPLAAQTPRSKSILPLNNENPNDVFKKALLQDDGGPSLKETQEWLARVLPTLGLDWNYYDRRVESVEFNQCKVKLTEKLRAKHAGTISLRDVYEFDLSKMDPFAVKIEFIDKAWFGTPVSVKNFYQLSIKASPGGVIEDTTIQYKDRDEMTDVKKQGTTKYASVGLYSYDRELAKRIAKALSRGMVLCGAKAEPF